MSPHYQPSPDKKISDRIYRTQLSGLFYLAGALHPDNRGFFTDIADLAELRKTLDIDFNVMQINQSRSKTNVVRGLHAEDWNKLITVTSGTAFCAIADVRPTSPTFMQVETFVLSKNPEELTGSLFISAGLGNSICALKGDVDYVYMVDKLYRDRDTSGDQAISLFDPDLKIDWPLAPEKMLISQRDQNATTLRQLYPQAFK